MSDWLIPLHRRLQVHLGLKPVYDNTEDWDAPLDQWPESWDKVPVTKNASIDKSVTGIEWVDREQFEVDLDRQPEAVKRRLEE